ncbi:hypothetical protein Ocepr_2025 [Oceanithermus profundus DSM 14977]|uniref:Lipoprotein n=1 Tax=Oceanithermus profundus (strain DSM 14977 / NBRC 100410 / VKM B-2274 / 506) TaxID=670487 RepID=E4U564_OCEP5|nr:hypothetical protein [Oceanithermus profundus]ADR37476.1 hypothetical protein Ocepr_2025 [Oceanithermus profundus DSM 14977]
MKKRWIFVGAVLTVLLAACGTQAPSGGGGTSSIDPREVAGTLSTANEQLYDVSAPLGRVGIPVPLLLLPFSSGTAPLDVASWDCGSVTVTGTLTDTDGDGIPVNATYDGRCSWSYSGTEGSFSGYWEYRNLKVQDPDDADPAAGIKVNGVVEWGYSGGGQSLTWTWTLTQHDFVKQSGGYGFTYVGNWRIVVNDTDNYAFDYNLSGTWAPDTATDPWGNGTLNASGDFSGSGPACTGWSLQATLSGVHFNGGMIDGGSATYTGTDCDGTSVTFDVTWTPTQVCITAGGNTICVPNG